MYFNSPGALGKPSWAVYDVMTRMNSPIKTINMVLNLIIVSVHMYVCIICVILYAIAHI